MPKATYNKNNEGITHFQPGSSTTPAKWDIEIISKPGGQRNMPTTPEFGHISREIRESEVLL